MWNTKKRIWAGVLLLGVLLLGTPPALAQWIIYPPYPGPIVVGSPISVTPQSSDRPAAATPSYGAASSDERRPSYYSEDYSGSDSTEAPLDQRTAEIRVRLPERAELWANGKKMTLTGPVREFVTPRLEEERVYTYVLKARWREDGFTVEKTLRVRTFAGNRVTVNFVRRPAYATPRPPVVRSEAPAETPLPPLEVEQKPIQWTAPRSLGVGPY